MEVEVKRTDSAVCVCRAAIVLTAVGVVVGVPRVPVTVGWEAEVDAVVDVLWLTGGLVAVFPGFGVAVFGGLVGLTRFVFVAGFPPELVG